MPGIKLFNVEKTAEKYDLKRATEQPDADSGCHARPQIKWTVASWMMVRLG